MRQILRFTFLVAAVACGGRATRNEPAEGTPGSSGGSLTSGTGGTNAGDVGGASSSGSSTTGSAAESSAGGSNAGSNAAGATETAGAGGNAPAETTAGATSGVGGTPANAGRGGGAGNLEPVPMLVPCDSSAQTGCESGSFCQSFGACNPTTESGCTGYCATRLVQSCDGNGDCPEGYECVPVPDPAGPTRSTCVEAPPACDANDDCASGFGCVATGGGGRCSPERVSCNGPIDCMGDPSPCAPGFVRSKPDGCYGPCIRVEHCACSSWRDCGAEPATCDYGAGTCAIVRAPAPRCLMHDPERTCADPRDTSYTFVDGRCEPVQSPSCYNNDVFFTQQECESYCTGQPFEEPCAEGFRHSKVCLLCGPGDGCELVTELCARVCSANDPCPASEGRCVDGVCHRAFCLGGIPL